MSSRRFLDFKGLRGAMLGVGIGIVISLSISLYRYLVPSPPRGETLVAITPRADSPLQPEAGMVQVLAGTDNSFSEVARPNPKGTAFHQIASALLHNGDFNGALKTATQVEKGHDRDTILKEIADQTLPAYDYNDIEPDDLNKLGGPAGVIEKLQRLRLITDLSGDSLKVGLLIRMAMYKGALEKMTSGNPATDEAGLISSDAIFSQAIEVANRMDSATLQRASFIWNWGILLTAILGVLGFVMSNLLAPILNACGKMIGASISEGFGAKFLANSMREDELNKETSSAGSTASGNTTV